MKIRSITYFFTPQWPLDSNELRDASAFDTAARHAFESAGYEVQTTRLASSPFPHLVPSMDEEEVVQLAQTLESASKEAGFDYLSLGPALPEIPESYAAIPSALAATEDAFFAGLMTTPDNGVSLPAVRACAKIIQQSAGLAPNGFANLRFAALANVPAGAPFFPAAYHNGSSPSFALATESADLAVDAFSRANSLEEAQNNLIETIESHARALNQTAMTIAQQYGLPFTGMDFTPAPFPEKERSIGYALECLGAPAVGLSGSLAAAAFLADTLDRAVFPRAGFNGIMLPVLEDATLASRAAEGKLTIQDLLLYSSVCGTGLDTVPLPGNTTTSEINSILLDLAALAQRLDKPLTARLMPIPGKKAGDPTGFDFAYFANSRVLPSHSQPLERPLAGEETFHLTALSNR